MTNQREREGECSLSLYRSFSFTRVRNLLAGVHKQPCNSNESVERSLQTIRGRLSERVNERASERAIIIPSSERELKFSGNLTYRYVDTDRGRRVGGVDLRSRETRADFCPRVKRSPGKFRRRARENGDPRRSSRYHCPPPPSLPPSSSSLFHHLSRPRSPR